MSAPASARWSRSRVTVTSVYRILQGAQPGRKDFQSDREMGRPQGADEPWIEHVGISVYDNAPMALAYISRYPVWIAEMAVPADARCSIAKTGPAAPFHCVGRSSRLVAERPGHLSSTALRQPIGARMSFTVLYRDTGSVIGHHADRGAAIRDAMTVALDRPDLSLIVGVVELDEDGMPVSLPISASDLLATGDPDAVAVARSHDATGATPPFVRDDVDSVVAEVAVNLASEITSADVRRQLTTVSDLLQALDESLAAARTGRAEESQTLAGSVEETGVDHVPIIGAKTESESPTPEPTRRGSE
jgi:hypothetical protein